MIGDYDHRIISAFEVFALNRNEEDFLENLNIISDIIKGPAECESPDTKNSPASFSHASFKAIDEPERKLIDLEPMGESNDEEEGENFEDYLPALEQNNFDSYTPNDTTLFLQKLEELKKNFEAADVE